MILLTIGSGHRDFRQCLDPKSRRRFAAYGALARRSYIIAFTGPGFERLLLENNVTVFPTNSPSRWLAPFHALKIGKNIFNEIAADEQILISAQDPFESGIVAWFLKLRFRGARLQLQAHTDIFSPYFRQERWENRIRVWLLWCFFFKTGCVRGGSARHRPP